MKYHLLKSSLFILVGVVLFYACIEPKVEDNEPPFVSITSPQNGSTVSAIVSIECISTDNDVIPKVELWVDDSSTGITDASDPFTLEWNTISYEDGEYSIFVRSTDYNENSSDSNPITLIVDNSGSYPTPVVLDSILYHLDGPSLVFRWSQNNDDNFSSYKLFESPLEDMSIKSLIFETDVRTQNGYYIYGIPDELAMYYQVVVENSWGLQSYSNIEFGYAHSFFKKTFGGSERDYGYSVQQTTDGGYIITGSTESFGNGASDVWLIKTDSYRNEEWDQTFGGSNNDIGYSVQQTTDGGYIIAGLTESFGNGNTDVWLIKTDPQGNEEWNQTFGGSNSDAGNSVQQTTDGGYIIAGSTDSFGNGSTDVWLIKTDPQGNEEWNQTFGGSNSDAGNSVQQTADSGYAITGQTSGFGWLIKTNSQGIEEWNQMFEGYYGTRTGNSVQQTTNGGYIITGTDLYLSDGSWLIKTNSMGIKEWEKTFWGRDNWGNSVQQTFDDGYIIAGYENAMSADGGNVWLVKTDSQGIEEWNQTFGGKYEDQGKSVKQTSDGGYIITGWTSNYGNGKWDVLLIKTDAEGNSVPYGD